MSVQSRNDLRLLGLCRQTEFNEIVALGAKGARSEEKGAARIDAHTADSNVERNTSLHILEGIRFDLRLHLAKLLALLPDLKDARNIVRRRIYYERIVWKFLR